MVVHSATLALNEQIESLRSEGGTPLHLGFGEAGLPVPEDIVRVLADAAGRNSYAPVAGSPEARDAAAQYLTRRGLPTAPGQVLLTPGSKAALYALIANLPGDLVLPVPSWVSYAPQAELAGKQTIGVAVPAEAGGVPDPAELAAALTAARADGLNPGILLLTTPDNPTGTVPSAELIKAVAALAEEHDLAIISDEIYRDLSHDPDAVVSPVTVVPERCFVTTGLSKCMSLGGYRIGVARFPVSDLGQRTQREVIGVASEIWSSMADPMQAVATHVFSELGSIPEHVAASRRLHARVATAVYDEMVAAGASCRAPQGGFYLYPDFEPLRAGLAARGVTTGTELATHLLEEHGVGVLAGHAFGDDPQALRFRAATSLLYGATSEQRWRALASDDPTELPWIADALGRLRKALQSLSA